MEALTVKLSDGKYIQSLSIQLETIGNRIKIISPYNKLLIDELKVMKGAKWEPNGKYWTILDCERNRYAFEYLCGFRSAPDKFTFNDDNCQRQILMAHQKMGVLFAINTRRCLLAFEMGLGKTLTAIEVMEYAWRQEQLFNWWLVAPFGAQKEWKRQLRQWNCKLGFVVVTTYESLEKHLTDSGDDEKFIPHGVIFDESVKLKNPSAKRSQAANELCRIVRTNNAPPVGKAGGYIIELSGAPAPRNPIDWWHQIECLQPGFIREGDCYKFRNRYANVVTEDHGFGPHSVIQGWKTKECEALGRRLAPLVLVKKKKDCLNLPDKIFDVISIEPSVETLAMAQFIIDICGTGALCLERLRELSDGFQYRNRESYTTAREGLSDPSTEHSDNGASNGDGVEICDDVARSVAQNRAKIGVVRELLDFYHTENGGPGRLVIYAAYQSSIDMLISVANEESEGWQAARIDGRGWSDPDVLGRFEDTEGDNICIVANPACVHGLTLSKTLCLVYYSNSFHVDHRIQSLDRRDRPGMDVNKATRIVDICHLPTDQYILNKLNAGISVLNITLDEIRRLYR